LGIVLTRARANRLQGRRRRNRQGPPTT
jgi:hypothetical protein